MHIYTAAAAAAASIALCSWEKKSDSNRLSAQPVSFAGQFWSKSTAIQEQSVKLNLQQLTQTHTAYDCNIFLCSHSARHQNRASRRIMLSDIEAERSHDDHYCNAVRQSLIWAWTYTCIYLLGYHIVKWKNGTSYLLEWQDEVVKKQRMHARRRRRRNKFKPIKLILKLPFFIPPPNTLPMV